MIPSIRVIALRDWKSPRMLLLLRVSQVEEKCRLDWTIGGRVWKKLSSFGMVHRWNGARLPDFPIDAGMSKR